MIDFDKIEYNEYHIESQYVEMSMLKYQLTIFDSYEVNIEYLKDLKKEIAKLKKGIKELIAGDTHPSIAMNLINDLIKKDRELQLETEKQNQREQFLEYRRFLSNMGGGSEC